MIGETTVFLGISDHDNIHRQFLKIQYCSSPQESFEIDPKQKENIVYKRDVDIFVGVNTRVSRCTPKNCSLRFFETFLSFEDKLMCLFSRFLRNGPEITE